MSNIAIFIAGMPATGKSSYARHLSQKMKLPLISKDLIKETIYNYCHYDLTSRESTKYYGTFAMSVAYLFADTLLKSNSAFIMESNFSAESAVEICKMLRDYDYVGLTVMFDCDIRVSHNRYWKRNESSERNMSLRHYPKTPEDTGLEVYVREVSSCRDFIVGEKFVVDTTNFASVQYETIDKRINEFMIANGFHAPSTIA